MEAGEGDVYKETVLHPKDSKERAIRKRRLIMIIIGILLIIIIAVIIGVVVSKSQGVEKALVVYPQTDGYAIRFTQGDPRTFQSHLDSINKVLEDYSWWKQTGTNFMNCSAGRSPSPSTQGVCRFNLNALGTKCTRDKVYGFLEGQPCILLQFNPPKYWQPQYFTKRIFPKDLPPQARSVGHVPIQCKETMDGMADLVGELEIHPVHGFAGEYFPYTGQNGYLAPLVMVRLMRPRSGVALMITCTVLDPVLDEKNNEAFTVDFTIIID